MWKNLKFSFKMSVMVGVFILFSVITGVGYHLMANDIRDIGIKNSGDAMLEGYKNELKDIVDVMAEVLSSASKNSTSEEEDYKIFHNLVNDARFFPDKSGYFFIYRHDGTVFVLPPKPELEGKNLIGIKDANGKLLVKEIGIKAKSGGGFVDYLWDKPGKGNLPKLSYALMIPNKPYWVGTGVYIDDVQEKEAQIFNTINDFSNKYLIKLYAILGAIFLLVILPLTWLMVKSIVNPLISLTETATEYSLGKLENEFIETERKDEIGALARAVKRLGRSTKIVMQKLHENDNRS